LIIQRNGDTALPAGVAFRIEGRTSGAEALVRTARFPLNLPLAGQQHAAWLSVR
jgi:hypothetical protein